jgi:ferredoxin
MRVWIDQDLCTGDGQCADICPEIFFMHDDEVAYRAYVRRVDEPGCGPNGAPALTMAGGLTEVPRSLKRAVREAAYDCPGECIFLERG